MKRNILWRMFEFFRLKIKQYKRKKFDDNMRRFFYEIGICDYDSFFISESTKIHSGSKLIIGKGLCVGDNCVIDSNDSHGIYIGKNLLMAQDVYIRGGNHDFCFFEDAFQNHGHCAKKIERDGEIFSIVIEDNVWIGRGATIISGAHIGKGCVIGAGAVVKSYVPEYSIVVGNPAKIVANRKTMKSFDERDDLTMFD